MKILKVCSRTHYIPLAAGPPASQCSVDRLARQGHCFVQGVHRRRLVSTLHPPRREDASLHGHFRVLWIRLRRARTFGTKLHFVFSRLGRTSSWYTSLQNSDILMPYPWQVAGAAWMVLMLNISLRVAFLADNLSIGGLTITLPAFSECLDNKTLDWLWSPAS